MSVKIFQIFIRINNFKINRAKDGGIESIFVGLMNDVSSKYDLSLVDTLQNHLFEVVDDDGVVVAIDLAATNIQRGRFAFIFKLSPIISS